MRTQSEAPLLHRPGVDLLVEMYANHKRVYTEFVRQIDNNNSFYRVATEGDFEPALVVNEATGVEYQNFETPYNRDYNYYKRGIGFSLSWETMNRGKYGLYADRGKKMGDSIRKSIEADMANFINLATTTPTATNVQNVPVTPDGVQLASASHLRQGGTYSNIVTGNPALSVTSLAQAIQELIRQPSHTNDPMMFMGPYKLLVPPELADLANRLVKSQKYPTTNDNDPNWGGGFISEVVVNPYFTSTTAWALAMTGAENPLVMVNSSGLRTYDQYDIDVDGKKFASFQIWAKVPRDPRGFVYSAGA